MGEASRERSIAACALVPAMGISCGRGMEIDLGPRGMRTMGGGCGHGCGAEGGWQVRHTGANCLAAGSGLQLPCARAAAAWLGAKMRSWRAAVVTEVRGVSGGRVRGLRVALSSLLLLLAHASEVAGCAHRRRLKVLRDGSSCGSLEIGGDGIYGTSHLTPTQLLLDAQGTQREERLGALAAVPVRGPQCQGDYGTHSGWVGRTCDAWPRSLRCRARESRVLVRGECPSALAGPE